MKKLLYLLCFLPLCLQAQTPIATMVSDNDSLSDTLPQRTSYQSFFGKNKTVWSLAELNLVEEYKFSVASSDSRTKSEQFDMESWQNNFDFFTNNVQQVACFSKADTVNYYTVLADSKSSGKLSTTLRVGKYSLRNVSDTFNYNGHSYTSIIGEDTVNGRLYRLYYDSIEVLWCDMSLMLGDTFRLPDVDAITPFKDDWSYTGQGSYWIVDSVYYLYNRKIIRFKFLRRLDAWWYTWWYRELPLYFIEGIGPTCGPFGKLWEGEYVDLPLLLCVYKDDTLDFMTSSAWGCDKNAGPGWYPNVVKEPKRATLTLQPNPAQDYILLRNEDASDLGGEVIITDAIGRVLRYCTMENAEMRINTIGYSSGTYFVRYRSRNGVQTLKFVKVQ